MDAKPQLATALLQSLPTHIASVVKENIFEQRHDRCSRSNEVGKTRRRNKFRKHRFRRYRRKRR